MTGEPTTPATTDARDPEGIRARLEFVVEVSELLARALDVAPALQGVAQLSAGWLCDVCAIDMLTREGRMERVAVAVSNDGLRELAERLRGFAPDPDAPVMRRVLEGQEVVPLPELHDADLGAALRAGEHRAVVEQIGLHAAVLLPLAARGTVRGSMLLGRAGAGRSFEPDDIAVAEDVARRVGLAAERSALLEQVTVAHRQASDLQRITDAALSHVELDTLLQTVLEPVASVLGADAAGLLLTDDRGEALVERASTAVDVGSREWPRIPLGAGVLGRIAAGEGPLAVEDVDSGQIASDVVAAQEIRSLLGAPLRVGDRTVGVIYVGTRARRSFQPDEVDLLGRAAARVALAVSHARAYSAEQLARDRVALLARAGEILGESFDVRGALGELAQVLVPALADWCTISLTDDPPPMVAYVDAPEVQAAHRLWEEFPSRLDAITGLSQVLRTGRPQLRSPIPEDDSGGARGGVAADPPGMRSVMVVPLIARARTLGAITLVRAAGSPAYTPDDLPFAQEVARRAAVALDTARLYRERDAVARTLQQSLLPPSLPSIPGVELAAIYHPAGVGDEVGGDFYDAFEVAGGGWVVVVGDVCGKGVEAAAFTGLVRHTIRAAALHEREPDRMLEMLNHLLLREVSDNRFCTVAAARVDVTPGGATIRVVCGGHPPPLLVRPGREVEEVCGPGTLLGVFGDIGLEAQEEHLNGGDVLVLYTDGVTEGRRDGEMFGEGRLRRLLAASRDLSAGGIADRIERAVLEFKSGAPDDDVAVMVLKPVAG
jgi:serine phosphatase RsbU (regulator of sigma subunit)/putative methionine-R-sulfoxide reductase with GAF domain